MTAPAPAISGGVSGDKQDDLLALVLSGAWGEAMQLRLEQITLHGHDARADDAAGPWRLLRMAATLAADATDMAWGDTACLSPRELAVLRRRILKSVAMAMAALDSIDRHSRGSSR